VHTYAAVDLFCQQPLSTLYHHPHFGVDNQFGSPLYVRLRFWKSHYTLDCEKGSIGVEKPAGVRSHYTLDCVSGIPTRCETAKWGQFRVPTRSKTAKWGQFRVPTRSKTAKWGQFRVPTRCETAKRGSEARRRVRYLTRGKNSQSAIETFDPFAGTTGLFQNSSVERGVYGGLPNYSLRCYPHGNQTIQANDRDRS